MNQNLANNPTFPLDLQQTELAWNSILSAQRIGIISHRHPDPDTIGSNLTLRELFLALGKETASFCVDPLPQSVQFMLPISEFNTTLDPTQYDLLISVDCGSTSQTAYDLTNPQIFQNNFLNIDHHASNDNFGTINIIHNRLSSTSEIIFNLFNHWNIRITPTIATYLLAGLYYDTGSFMHPNTTLAVLQMAEKLATAGARQQDIVRHLFKNFTLSKFHLWGETLSNIKVTAQNSVVGVVFPEDFQKHNATSEELSDVIAYLNMVKDNDFAILLNQKENGLIKGSLRTQKNSVNVSDLAATLGGGGHRKASGFSMPGKVTKETIWKIVQ